MSLESLWQFLSAHAYAVVLVGTFVDATGIPFPGRLLLVTAGGLAAAGDVSAALLIAVAMVGAMLGDHVWYAIGLLGSGRFVALYCRLLPYGGSGCAERAREYLKRFGPAAVIIGRFVAGVRILVTPLAAESGMPYARYVVCDVIGALLWCSLWILIGFAIGDRWLAWQGEHGKEATGLLVAMGGAAMLVTTLGSWLWLRRQGQQAHPPSS
jgi:membrane protein DedA with SNARE-associated domain